MPAMKKKTVNVPGVGAVELFFGPGVVDIRDIDGTARVEAQGYLLTELQAATGEGRKPVPLHTQIVTLTGQAYLDFQAAHQDFKLAVVAAAWEALSEPLDTDSGQKDTNEQPVFVNFFADAVDVDLGA